ncbi:hypothetical protein HYALB_00000788 [Hymenoscyphus albidus]|uniref:IgE-binding protein n=1 Tax=Hymenoscyphus albidus TaxID=595503 RepID=A0A9N9LTF4_9HELO|nr:hypothetical protein HYALB_00000788 [Hymenoscyphus albidus]
MLLHSHPHPFHLFTLSQIYNTASPKMFINVLLLATTASLASAQAPAKKVFTLAVSQPNGDLDGKPINAFEKYFYTGIAEPKTFCVGSDCPIPANSAPMTVFTNTPDFLYVQVPGGQQTFVEPQGPLAFTEANTNKPENGVQGGWVNATYFDRQGTPLYELQAWDKPESGRGVALCPSAIPDALQVFVKTPGFSRADCTDILGFKAIPWVEDGFGAWAYA